MLDRIVRQDARRLRLVLKAVALGQRPDDLEPDDLALVALHRDGLLVSLDEAGRRVLEALVDELVCLGIGPAEAPERLAESVIASSVDFTEVVAEYVELLRGALEEPDADAASLDGATALLGPAVVEASERVTVAGALLCSAVLLSLLTPGAEGEERDGWISADRRRHLRSLLESRARVGTLPPPVELASEVRALPEPRRS